MTSKPISLFWDKVKITCPVYPSLMFNPYIPLYGTYKLSLPRLLLTNFFYLGAFTATYFCLYWSYRGSKSLYNRIKSMFNAKKFLDS